jgi:hypothetical protein
MKQVTHSDRHTWHRLSLTLALAAGVGFALPAAATVSQLPMARHEGKVTYLSGGIGEREAKAIKEVAPKYPLEVEFIKKEPSGPAAYLAEDKLAIRDHAGKTVLSTTSNGPFLLAKLPPGRYTVMATNDKTSKERRIDLASGKHEKIVFEW